MASSRFPLCSTQQRILSFNKLQQCTSVTNSEHEKNTHDHIEIIYFRSSVARETNVTCETKISELPKHERQVSTQKDHISKLRTFLLTSFLSAFVMMIGIIGLPEFFYMQGKGSNISRDFRHCDDHPSRKEVRDQDQDHSKKCDTSFPLLQTLDSFLTFDAILHLLLR